MWLVWAFVSALGAAGVAILGKMGLQDLDSTLATTVRSIIMAGFLILTSLSLGKFAGFNLAQFTGRQWLLIIGSGIAGAISWLAYFLALKYGPASGVVAVDRLSIVIVVVLAVILLGEALTWRVAVGAALMVGGAILVALK